MKTTAIYICSALLCAALISGCAATRTMQLINASSSGQTDTVQRLIEKEGLDVNTRDIYGNTALITAAKEGRVGTVKYLLSKKADVNIRNDANETALMLAEKNNKTEVVKLLKNAGAKK